ncbi:MAG: threonine synthase [Rhodospirillales bacterium]|nr:threonine synthase [Rhodospirillales bacterium]
MKYVSTRGRAPVLSFDDALLAGLAADGGLYVPEAWPQLSKAEIQALRGISYDELTARVCRPFLSGGATEAAFPDLARDAFSRFDHPAVAPLRQIGPGLWLLELFHGPTLSFKDYALQLVGRLFDTVLAERDRRVTVIGATSGDTGSAAIEALKDRERIEAFILHPKGRVSEVQRRQMTTVAANNIHNVAVEGTFDDCQDLVKAMFNDAQFRARTDLTAVNSINWARVMVQVVYYFAAAVALGAPQQPVTFAVPTGNFGNVLAGWVARRMGLPVTGFVVASNRNDILTRFYSEGEMRLQPVQPTLSPSMDIQISSNFERLLFELYGRRGELLARAMDRFRKRGRVRFGAERWRRFHKLFTGHALDDAETVAVIRQIYETTGELLDPHTAIGLAAGIARHDVRKGPLIAVATAHPAKFPDAVEKATGIRPRLPSRLADLYAREERLTTLPNELGRIEDFIVHRLNERAAA